MSRPAIGVELGARRVHAVVLDLDAEGAVIARATRRAADGSLARAAQTAVQEIVKGARESRPAGICTHEADDEATRAALDELRALLGTTGDPVGTGAAAAVAEAWIGAARGMKTVVALIVGEQISAGILLDGTPWRGAHGMAGAAAWLALNPVERQDYRRTGCLDAEVSSHGVARRLTWRIQSGDHSDVLDRAGDLATITADLVYEGARAGDGVAISVVRDTAKYIGMAVANLVAIVDPELVALCGDVSRAGDLLLDPVRQECSRRLPARLAAACRIEMSPLGEDAAAIGAARLAQP